LLGNGVYCGLSGTTTATQLATSGHRIYVLEQDLHAAGAAGRTDTSVSVIGFDAFVELTETFAQHLNWA